MPIITVEPKKRTIMALYHSSIGFPENIQAWDGLYNIYPTVHALQAAKNDRYARIQLKTHYVLENPFEVETNASNKVIKACYRLEYSEKYDIILVIKKDEQEKLILITCWLNKVSDNHKTLKCGAYC